MVVGICISNFFFFKQKTAYEITRRDWSSDVCSSDLRGGRMARDVTEQLTKYLTDAHSIEEQALQQLRRAPDLAGEPKIAEAFREHLAETEEHERLVRGLLESRGASPNVVKDAVMRAGGMG